MLKLISISLATAIVVIFGVANAHEVFLGTIFGEPVVVRLVFLVAVAFVGGVMTTTFYRMGAHARARRHRRRVARKEGRRGEPRQPRLLQRDWERL